MNELISKIEEWAHARNIINGSKPIDQAMKLFSEFGELADNVGKGRDCRDDIGDIFVVLTVISSQMKHRIEIPREVLIDDLSQKQLIIELCGFLGDLAYNIETNKPFTVSIENNLMLLMKLCETLGYTLQECVQIAYDDIKGRKGIMSNGVFIKDDDPAYADVIAAIENNLTP